MSGYINKKLRRLDVGVKSDFDIVSVYRTHNDMHEKLFDMHHALELGIVRSGRMMRIYNDCKIECEAGDVWLCNTWEPHGFSCLQPPIEVAVIMLAPQLPYRWCDTGKNIISPLFLLPPSERPRLDAAGRGKILELLKDLPSTEENNDYKTGLKVQCVFLEIIVQLLLSLEKKLPSVRHDGQFMYHILDAIISKHGMISLDEAAQMAQMPSTKFNLLFSDLFGMSFRNFSLCQRLAASAEDLKDGSKTLDEIAMSWGFTDKSHFHHRFTAYYKVSPGEYRKQARSE